MITVRFDIKDFGGIRLFVEHCVDTVLFVFANVNFVSVAVFNVYVERTCRAVLDYERTKVPVSSVVLNEYIVVIAVSIIYLECSDTESTIVVVIVLVIMLVIMLVVMISIGFQLRFIISIIETAGKRACSQHSSSACKDATS